MSKAIYQTYSLKTLLTSVFVFMFNFYSYCQFYNHQIGKSKTTSKNVNHKDGTFLQDQKYSTGLFVQIKGKNYGQICSCNLLNNVTQDKSAYISTAAHCIKDFNVGETKFATFSFLFEIENETKRDDSAINERISKVYDTNYQILMKDPVSDIALLKLINPNLELLKNAYASGWDNTSSTRVWGSISHPRGDHKKVMIKPSEVSFKYAKLQADGGDIHKGYFFKTKNLWNNVFNTIENGSSGSGIFSENSKLIKGVAILGTFTSGGHNTFSSILNNWYKTTSATTSFINFLDPNTTFLNTIPGGFYNELLPLTENNFKLVMNPNETLSTPSVNYSSPQNLADDVLWIKPMVLYDFYRYPNGKDQTWMNLLGIKSDNITNNSDLVLSVFYLEKQQPTGLYDEKLLFGVHSNANSSANPLLNHSFTGDAWSCDDNRYPACNRVSIGNFDPIKENSQDFKRSYIPRIFSRTNFINSSELRIPIKVQLTNIGSSPIGVQAISYHGDVPKNALQLFKPNEVFSKFKSNQYKLSRGLNSETLFINSFAIGDDKNLQRYITGNNGGYLNLVNQNFLLGNNRLDSDFTIRTSYYYESEFVENKIGFLLNVNTTLPSFYYKVWIDYFPDIDSNNYYNFVNDPTPHNIELLAEGNSSQLINGNIYKIKTMPLNTDLNMAPGERKIFRLRVAVSNQDNIVQDGIYQNGEVEDYLIKIQVPTKAEALASTAKIALKNENKRISQITIPQESAPPSTTNQNAAQNQIFAPIGSQQSNALVLGFSITDFGTLPKVFSPVLLPVSSILSQDYNATDSNLNPSNTSDFECPNPSDADNDTDPDFDLINFDPNNPDAWSYWQEFTTLYNNLSRIIRFWDNLRQQPEVPFVEDANSTINYALFNQFINYYNNTATFKNAVDEIDTVYDLMQLIYNTPTLFEAALGEQNATIYLNIYGFIIKYQCYIDQLIEYSNNFDTVLNVTNNQARVAIDWWGEVIPNNYNERTLVNNITLTEYPKTGTIGIIYQDKGDTNSTTVAINSSGNLIYEIKNGTEVKSITATSVVPLNQEVLITTIFDDGIMKMFLNNTEQGTNTLSKTTIPSYTNYTEPNNGARWGAPVYNYTNPTENTNKTDIEAQLHEFLLFDKVLNATEIEVLVSSNTTNPILSKEELVSDANADIKETSIQRFSIFPNPVKDKLNVLVDVKQAGPLKLNIKDLTGKKVYELNKPILNPGLHLIELQNLNLPAALYLLNIKAGDLIRTEKIVVE
ncbi:MAG TPA: hypothetical protein DDZ41_03855 [Flavobacterium sp.]|nr:hypothetical protein [Flavobacterium sp.]